MNQEPQQFEIRLPENGRPGCCVPVGFPTHEYVELHEVGKAWTMLLPLGPGEVVDTEDIYKTYRKGNND